MPDLHLLAGAFALDALDDVERTGFERHLHACADCTSEVGEFRETAASLAEGISLSPPETLKFRVFAEVRATRQLSPGPRISLPRPSLRRIVATAAAAIIIAGSAGLGGVAWQGHRASERAQLEATRIARVMTDPSRVEVVGVSSVGGTATVVAAGGSAVFAADGLTALPDGKQYQLWRVDKTGTKSAGLLKLRDGMAQLLVSGVNSGGGLAVTVEPDGGSKQPTTVPVLTLKVA